MFERRIATGEGEGHEIAAEGLKMCLRSILRQVIRTRSANVRRSVMRKLNGDVKPPRKFQPYKDSVNFPVV